MATNQRSALETVIDPATRVGMLALSVSHLGRSVDFYTGALGLTGLARDDATATLGIGSVPVLQLIEQPGARPWPRETRSFTGLFHFAILMPTRADLGRWLGHWLTLGLPLGQGDHLVSEALYISDPDQHGIEIYRDRPQSQWRWTNGYVQMATDPVDIQGLLREAQQAGQPWQGMPAGAHLGHIHLQVGAIPEAGRFYQEILGFGVRSEMPTALFLAAGSYHHHIGANTWHSRGAGPAPADMVSLRFFTIDLPDEPARQALLERLQAAGYPYQETPAGVVLQDPWHTTIILQLGAARDLAAAAGLARAYRESVPAHR